MKAVVDALDRELGEGSPLDELTVERLVGRAGVGIGSFYEYFADRNAVIGALIQRLTQRNFDDLAAHLANGDASSVEALIEQFASVIVERYLGNPARNRVIVEGIGRLGMMPMVTEERDRFAQLLAVRLVAFDPTWSKDASDRRMRLVADATMGVISAELLRKKRTPIPLVKEHLARMSIALVALEPR